MVRIVQLKGSAPREVGAEMTVFENAFKGTIGGGSMEHDAIAKARELLSRQQLLGQSQFASTQLQRIHLNPKYDQCCGGVVIISFDYFPETAWAKWLSQVVEFQKTEQSYCVVTSSKFDQEVPSDRVLLSSEQAPDNAAVGHNFARQLLKNEHQNDGCCHLLESDDNEYRIVLLVEHNDLNITLFGAGHVGKAIIQVMSNYPCKIRWVDNRKSIFPDINADNIERINCQQPAAAITDAPANSYFLVMTHSHSLDYELCDHILARDDVAYLGLIGSQSKALRFRKQFKKQGLAMAEIDKIICPIGIDSIRSKAPAAIAISIAAQLISHYEKPYEIKNRSLTRTKN